MTTTVASEQALSAGRPEDRLEPYRRELTGYCYRMLGSAFDADDAVQETMVRAWRALDKFDGRSTLRSWLYRIATNVCYDSQSARQRRAMPMDMSPSASPPVLSSLGTPLEQSAWVEPIPDGRVMPDTSDPAELTVARESVRLAFVAALQHLPARQRAVLILREVLRWKADEVAELLDTTVPSVNSALQRARATMAASSLQATQAPDPMDDEHAALLARYVDAFERYDMQKLTALIHEDATQSMPPYDLWLRGRDDIFRWWVGPGAGCRGSRVISTVTANGSATLGSVSQLVGA
ncbi:MAG: sigma-70 family RNA polymerase sigma factor [Actinomycetota bacterium]|nr:sigma-70 family RNA polymerase sigma factor [Actinomycetota bacterium]